MTSAVITGNFPAHFYAGGTSAHQIGIQVTNATGTLRDPGPIATTSWANNTNNDAYISVIIFGIPKAVGG